MFSESKKSTAEIPSFRMTHLSFSCKFTNVRMHVDIFTYSDSAYGNAIGINALLDEKRDSVRFCHHCFIGGALMRCL